MNRRILRAALAAALPLAFVGEASALDANARVLYTGDYTNNTGQSPDNETSEWIHRPGLTVGLSHSEASVTADASYLIERQIHQSDTFGDETVASGNGSLNWNVVPDRLALFASNSRTDTTINPRGSNNPDNRQTVDSSSVGGTLSFDAISNHHVDLRYSYGIGSAEETNTDSKRQTGTVSYVVPLSPTRSLSLSGSVTRARFDNPLSPDFESRSGNLAYSSSTRVLELSLSAGYQTTDRELDRPTVDGFVGSLGATYSLSDASSVTLSASRSIGDNYDAGAQGIATFTGDRLERTDTNEVSTTDNISLGFDWAVGVNRVGTSLFYRTRDYEATVVDEENYGVSVDISRELTRTSTLSLNGTVEERSYDDRDETLTRAQLRYSINRWRRLTVAASVSYGDRNGDEASVEYDEWRGSITLGYQLVGGAR